MAIWRSYNNVKDKERNEESPQPGTEEEDIFYTEEIKIEEMAIDGICGVY
jgi:mycofactocin precursor